MRSKYVGDPDEVARTSDAVNPIPPPDDPTLAAFFVYIQARNPAALQVWCAQTEEEFNSGVEAAVENAIVDTESGARQFRMLCERGLSQLLASLLRAAAIDAVAEEYHNGHVDVTVTHHVRKAWRVLGECKLYDGYKHHCNGCAQVLKRYASGRARRVLCLDYFLKEGMYTKLQELRDAFDSDLPHAMSGICKDHSIKGGFVSSHQHATGIFVEILHIGCNLYLAE